MTDPFLIEGPACISFSGGRTSGYMLWRILQAHGGKLPDDVVVMFANTGKEMGETLDFVQECSERWNVPITWVEYAGKGDDGKQIKVVDWHTASRNGEPYERLIVERNYLPNPVARFCTVELKVRPMHRYLKALGWDAWTSCVGMRADEPRRVAKLSNVYEGNHETRIAPLAQAGIAVEEVGRFWSEQPFDLRLPNMHGKTMHGNCDLCFLKGAHQLLALIRERPERAIWWMNMEQYSAENFVERTSGDSFRFKLHSPSYAAMHKMATQHGELFAFDDEPLQDCMCTD